MSGRGGGVQANVVVFTVDCWSGIMITYCTKADVQIRGETIERCIAEAQGKARRTPLASPQGIGATRRVWVRAGPTSSMR